MANKKKRGLRSETVDIYWVGQKVHSGFSITSDGKIQTNFLTNLILYGIFFKPIMEKGSLTRKMVLPNVQKFLTGFQVWLDYIVFKQTSIMLFGLLECCLSIAKHKTATWSEAQGDLLPHKAVWWVGSNPLSWAGDSSLFWKLSAWQGRVSGPQCPDRDSVGNDTIIWQ